jgi:hypothetical protein
MDGRVIAVRGVVLDVAFERAAASSGRKRAQVGKA